MRLHRIIALMAATVVCSSGFGQTVDDFLVEQKLISSDGFSYNFFGGGVSNSGDTAVIGSPLDGVIIGGGSAYIFERDGTDSWTEVQKLIASDEAGADYFGTSVSISGDRVVVGAYGNSDNGFSSGSAYIFERDEAGTWTEVQKLTASDGAEDDRFGWSVSISGDRVVVGADYDNDNGSQSGSAYIFERDGEGTWTEVQKLTASDRSASNYFGWSVSISGDRVVVGARRGNNGKVSNTGCVYIFEQDGNGTWTEMHKLTASDGGPFDYFGAGVSISGDRVVVGAYGKFNHAGSAYIFERDGEGTWTEVRQLNASDQLPPDSFGFSVSISGENLLIGAPYDSHFNGTECGSAYMFDAVTVINLDNGNQGYRKLQAALNETLSGDRLAVRSSAFAVEGIINTSSLPLTFIAVEPIEIGDGLMFLPAEGTNFIDSGDVDAAGYSLSGSLIAPQSGTLIFSDLGLNVGGELIQDNASLFIYGSMNNEAGIGYLAGNIFADEGDVSTSIDGTNRVSRDTDIYADYTNDGTTIIQRGILYIYGDLVNTGTLSGEYNNGFTGGGVPEPGDGFNIGGSYTIGQDATLSMPNPVWWLRVAGDLDIAIDDPANFTMSEATIALNGAAQTFEMLGADFGATDKGFDPSNYPIGALRIGNSSTTTLLNAHANSGDDACEVLYVNELFVAAGGTLVTGGCTIYARSATINGTVDDPEAIVIVEGTPDCPADLTGDGEVSGADLGLMIAFWGTPGGDLTGDGTTTGADLGLLIASWGVCP
jgi:hypothetical protein